MRKHATAIGVMLLIAVACDRSGDGRPTLDLGRLRGIPIASALDSLDGDQADVIRAAMQQVPHPLPQNAVSLVKMLERAKPSPRGLTIDVPADGILRTRMILASPGSNGVRLKLSCLRDGLQVACSREGPVWEVVLPASTLAAAAIELTVVEGDRMDLIVIVEGDGRRSRPASTALSVVVGTPNDRETVSLAPAHAAVFGGCDFATITTDTSPRATFQPPGIQPQDRQLFLIVQPCPVEGETDIVRAVAVVDGRTVEQLAGLESFVQVTQPALVVPMNAGDAGSELQVVVLRRGKSAWITHPVRLT